MAMVAFLGSCQKNNQTPDAPDTPDNANTLQAQIRALPDPEGLTPGEIGNGELPPLDPLAPQVDEETIEEGVFDGIQGIFINHRKVYNSGFAFDELSIFNPSESQIFPGSVFVGSSITNGKYLKLKGTTGEIVWSAKDLIPTTPMNTYVANFVNPKSSDYNMTVQRWFGMQSHPLSATTMFEVNEVSTSTEIGIKLGVGYQKEDLMAKLNLSSSHQNMKTHVLVKAIQKTFSIAVDIPDGFILKNAKVEDMDGVKPVYVSEVFYGRMGFAVISSNHEYHDVVAALNLNIPTENINIELESKYKEILDASVSKTRIIGGTSEDHGYGMSMGWEGFKKTLSAPLTPSSAKPIAYTLRYVHDNSVARVVLTSDFVRNESYFVPEMDQLVLRFSPRSIRAKADNVKPLFVYGKVFLEVNGMPKQVIFERNMKDYVRIDDPEQNVDLGEFASTEINIKRPKGMSMTEFLNMKVTLSGQFAHSNAAGTAPVYTLGQNSVNCTVRDLMMSAMRGTMNFFTQEKRSNRREANIVFDLQMDNGVRVISGSYANM